MLRPLDQLIRRLSQACTGGGYCTRRSGYGLRAEPIRDAIGLNSEDGTLNGWIMIRRAIKGIFALSSTVAVVLALGVAPALAQSNNEHPTHIPTPQSGGPFGTQWAKPGGTTGSYIYMDPRLKNEHNRYRQRRAQPCPPSTGRRTGNCR